MVDLITYLAARLGEDDAQLHRMNAVGSAAPDGVAWPRNARLVAEVARCRPSAPSPGCHDWVLVVVVSNLEGPRRARGRP
jgi:hypothetical protein